MSNVHDSDLDAYKEDKDLTSVVHDETKQLPQLNGGGAEETPGAGDVQHISAIEAARIEGKRMEVRNVSTTFDPSLT